MGAQWCSPRDFPKLIPALTSPPQYVPLSTVSTSGTDFRFSFFLPNRTPSFAGHMATHKKDYISQCSFAAKCGHVTTFWPIGCE